MVISISVSDSFSSLHKAREKKPNQVKSECQQHQPPRRQNQSRQRTCRPFSMTSVHLKVPGHRHSHFLQQDSAWHRPTSTDRLNKKLSPGCWCATTGFQAPNSPFLQPQHAKCYAHHSPFPVQCKTKPHLHVAEYFPTTLLLKIIIRDMIKVLPTKLLYVEVLASFYIILVAAFMHWAVCTSYLLWIILDHEQNSKEGDHVLKMATTKSIKVGHVFIYLLSENIPCYVYFGLLWCWTIILEQFI